MGGECRHKWSADYSAVVVWFDILGTILLIGAFMYKFMMMGKRCRG